MNTKIFLLLYGICFLLNLYVSKAFPQESYWDSINNEKQYFDSLSTADEKTFQHEFEYPFIVLLDENQKKTYFNSDSLSLRKSFIISYWKMMNPNPLMPENDWLVNFIARCIYVKKYFASSKPPFFDDRGKYFIKYGKPTNRYRDSGGRKTVRLFKDRGIYQYLSNLYSGFPPGIYYWVYPNESWVYRNIGQDFIIHFVKEGIDFKEVKSLTKALSTGIAKNVAWYWSDLIQYRAYLSPSLTRTANNLLQLENELYFAAYTGKMSATERDNLLPHRRIFEQKTIYEAKVTMNKRTPPFFIHYPVHAFNELNFFNDIAQFRGQNDSTKVDIVFLSPLEKSIFRSKSDTISIEFQYLVRDLKYNSIAQSKYTLKFPLKLFKMENLRNAVSNLSFVAFPQQGDLTLQIKRMNDGRIGFSKKTFNIKDFSGQNLMISDIQFFTEITNKNQLQILPATRKQNIIVTPYPYQKIRKSSPVFCYFEIYNLRTAGITNEFEISLRVFTYTSGKSIFKKFSTWLTGAKKVAISIVHSQPVTGDIAKELISIDFSNLTNGTYRLEITVTDPLNKSIFATIQKDIVVID